MRIILATLLYFFSLNAFAAEISVATQAQIQNLFDKWRGQEHIPGAALAIQLKGQPQAETFYSGTTLLQGKVKISANSPFQIGSITKTFISALILQLEAEGKLKLDDSLGLYFPEYPRWQHITIRQLLTMRSGIYNYSQALDPMQMTSAQRDANWQAAQLCDIAYRHQDYFPAGAGWHYSNTNYVLAGRLIERLTGKSLGWNLNNRFINQYKLTHTYYFPSHYPAAILQSMAHGYRDDQDITSFNMSSYGAAGAMISTVTDISSWIYNLFSGTVLKPAQLKEFMITIPFAEQPPKPKGARYGLGVYSNIMPGLGKVWWYSGVTEGYMSLFIWVPTKGAIISATINRRQGDQYGLLMPKQRLYNELIALLKQSKVF